MLKEKNLTLAPCTELQKLNNADAPGLTVQESKVTLGGGDEDTKDTAWRL